mmetsp:Transcript_29686/g.58842  ORF Transcript_29686/g.58842 Transcript_29686/m.58842 type:complete len:626 (+) Transcript_29686:852-2729(+)
MPPKVERHKGNAGTDPVGDHRHNLDLAAFGPFDPDLRAITHTKVVGVPRVDLDEHVLLQLGQPRVRPCLVAAALIFDQAAGGEDDWIVLREVLLLDRRIQRRQAVGVTVLVGGVIRHKVSAVGVQRLAVDRHRIGEGPHNSPRLGIAKGRTAMLDRHPLDAARQVGFPVGLGARNGVNGGAFIRRQITVPTQIHQHLHRKLGISILNFRPNAIDPFGQQVLTVPLHAKARTEGQPPLSHRLGHVIEVRRARVIHLGRAPAGPWQTVVIAIRRTTHRLQRGAVERVLVRHVLLDPLGRLAGVTHRPHAAIDLAQCVFDVRGQTILFQLDVAEDAIMEAKLLREKRDDLMIGLGLEKGINDLFTPLDGPVRRRDRATRFELGTSRQQIDTIGPIMQHGRDSGERVNHDQHVQLFHGLLHLDHAGLRVRRMPPKHHGPHLVRVVHVLGVLKDTIDPARDGNTRQVLKRLFLAVDSGGRGELTAQPFGIFLPNARPVGPGPSRQTVIAWQRVGQNTKVRGTLHVVVAAEDVGAATGRAHVAKGKLQDAVGAGVVVAVGVLRATHTPDHGAGAVVGQSTGHTAQLGPRGTGHTFDFFRGPLGDLFLDLVHAPDTGADELFVFPTVFEDVP